MHDHHDTHSIERLRLADMRQGGYRGPAYLRGRPAYEYLQRRGLER